MQQPKNRISTGAPTEGNLTPLVFPDIKAGSRRTHEERHRRSNPPSAPPPSERPIEPPIEPPTDLPTSATIPPTTLSVTERVTLRAISCPVDNRPRFTLVPKIVAAIAPSCPKIPPPAAPSATAGPARRFCKIS